MRCQKVKKCHYGRGSWKKKLDIMKLKLYEVNFDLTWTFWGILTIIIYVTSEFTSLCLSLIMSISFFTNFLHSVAVWVFDIWQIIGNSLKYVFSEYLQWITQWATWLKFHYLIFFHCTCWNGFMVMFINCRSRISQRVGANHWGIANPLSGVMIIPVKVK